MVEKKVVLVGVGTIMQMVKSCLSELKGITVIESVSASSEDLKQFVERESPSTIIVEQSTTTQGELEMLLLIARETNIKVVEVNSHSNTIQVAHWHQVQLEQLQDFLAVL